MLWSPSSCMGTTRTPGVFMGTITMEMPLCLDASGSVRTASQQ